jgi:hypothetical protein
MGKALIRLLYRKIIDAGSQDVWEKLVFEDTYKEFLMQAQTLNPDKKYNTFSELILNVPAASKLSFLVSPSITGYLKQLNGKIPNIVNLIDRHFVPFKNYRFEIINSDIRDKSAHQVAINFISEPLIWYDTIGDKLLVSVEEGTTDERGEVLTEMFVMQPFLSIFSIKKTTGDDYTV